jgi:phage-related protein
LRYFFQFVKDKSLRKSNKALSATNEFKISQIVDNGKMIQLTLIENVSTEPISQKQLIIENVAKKLDSETKEQVMPLLEAILQSQPTVNIKTYQQTQITIAMPKSRYDNMGRPQVGNIIGIDMKKI